MSQRTSIHELAELELNETAAFYEAQRPGPGADFLDELERALVHVLAHPEAAPTIRWSVRKKLLLPFPHARI